MFACSDGDILLSIQNEREWENFCADVMGDAAMAHLPLFATMTARVENRSALDGRIADLFAQHSKDEMAASLKKAGIAFGMLNTIDGLISHPQLRTVTYDTPDGPVAVIAPPAQTDEDAAPFRAVPAIGQHSDAIRAEFTNAQ